MGPTSKFRYVRDLSISRLVCSTCGSARRSLSLCRRRAYACARPLDLPPFQLALATSITPLEGRVFDKDVVPRKGATSLHLRDTPPEGCVPRCCSWGGRPLPAAGASRPRARSARRVPMRTRRGFCKLATRNHRAQSCCACRERDAGGRALRPLSQADEVEHRAVLQKPRKVVQCRHVVFILGHADAVLIEQVVISELEFDLPGVDAALVVCP